ncbi:hypothetical protein [Arthrobacter sp. B0490]|uniref:hypothetical protein n=1 Tax=Arthrobacter sp. B0490 TaxID=2058891 RepID=UPI000CE49B14|nr:hypothetical protein [Arthrobacter sp. B0490]
MNHDTPDGAEGLFRPQLQSALAVAGRLGEILARQRAERNEQMLRAQDAERRQLQERFEAERAVMRTQLGAVYQPQFWESARPEDIASQYALAQQWEPFDDMARLSREHMHDEIHARYNLTPEEYLEEHGQALRQVAVDVTPDGQEATTNRDAQRDHAEAERKSAVVAAGDLQNDVDTQNAAASAEELWDSGDRRTKHAEFLTKRVGITDIGRDGVAAVLAADLSNGTPPSAAIKAGRHSSRREDGIEPERVTEKHFGLE